MSRTIPIAVAVIAFTGIAYAGLHPPTALEKAPEPLLAIGDGVCETQTCRFWTFYPALQNPEETSKWLTEEAGLPHDLYVAYDAIERHQIELITGTPMELQQLEIPPMDITPELGATVLAYHSISMNAWVADPREFLTSEACRTARDAERATSQFVGEFECLPPSALAQQESPEDAIERGQVPEPQPSPPAAPPQKRATYTPDTLDIVWAPFKMFASFFIGPLRRGE